MTRTARKKPTEPRPFRLHVEGYATREAVAYADLPDDRRLTVRVGTPGTYVTERPSATVEVQCDGPAGYVDGRAADRREIDVYADDLDALVATLTEAVRIAREQGVIPHA